MKSARTLAIALLGMAAILFAFGCSGDRLR